MAKRGLVLIAVLMLVSSLAEGATWLEVYSDEAKVVYIDSDNFSRKGDTVKFWEQVALLKNDDQFNWDIKGTYLIHYIELDCLENKWRYLQGTAYFPDGKSTTNNDTGEWLYVIPDSHGEFLLNLCKINF